MTTLRLRAAWLAVACSALLLPTGDVVAQQAADAELPSPLRLEHVVRFARANRAEVVAMRARARAAGERPAIVSALEDPMISPSLDHLPFMLHGADVSLSIEQRFPLSRELGNRGRAAKAEAKRLRAETERVGLDVELDAASAFLMVHERRQMVRVVERQLELARQLASATSVRYASGTGAQPDVLRAEIEVGRLEADLASLRSEVLAAEAMLNASLARPADAPLPPLESAAATEAPSEWTVVRKVALGNRPELSAGRAEVLRSQAEVSVMESMDAPMALVRTGPAYTMTDGFGWMLMVGLSIPIWRDRINSGVREAQAMVAMSRADLSAMSRMVEGEAAASRHRVLAARARYLALHDELVPRARRVIEPTLAGYSAGTLPLVSVIEAAQTLWSVEAELISAEFELGFAWARLDRATAKRAERP
jgi:cobalt-zinc-cadmium efflux system outer membrane protein